MSRSNPDLVMSRWTVTPPFNTFLLRWNMVRCLKVVKRSMTVSLVLLARSARSTHASGMTTFASSNNLLIDAQYYFWSIILTFLDIFHSKTETSTVLLTFITTLIKFLTIPFHLILQKWILTLQFDTCCWSISTVEVTFSNWSL